MKPYTFYINLVFIHFINGNWSGYTRQEHALTCLLSTHVIFFLTDNWGEEPPPDFSLPLVALIGPHHIVYKCFSKKKQEHTSPYIATISFAHQTSTTQRSSNIVLH